MAHSLAALAELLGGELRGDAGREILGIRALEAAGPADLSFVSGRRLRRTAERSRAGALLVGLENADLPQDRIVVTDPYGALADLLPLFDPTPRPSPGVHSTAIVAAAAVVHPEASVGPYAVIGEHTRVEAAAVVHAHVVVGRDCLLRTRAVLHPGVVLYDGSEVGEGAVLHAGVVLGSDGYGYASGPTGHRKLAHLGRAVVEGEVEIGANSTVDRGLLEETRIGAGTKIDNLVMVAHNVQVGRRCLLVAQSGIAGSTKLGDGVVLAAQSGIIGHVEVGDGVVIATKSALLRGAEAGERVAGIPAGELGA
ncbi:MAG: UDP-3-O-(3-hydroxymyristoyl)glucosamine N-acyltransferase, partial [Thermoanaerobaculia bacterium]